MISNTLKVGDKFTDLNRTFEVLAVTAPGVYISKCIKVEQTEFATNTPVKAEVKEEVKSEVEEDNQLDSFNSYTKTEINRLKTTELEKVCEQLGLEKASGVEMKRAIIKKLGL